MGVEFTQLGNDIVIHDKENDDEADWFDELEDGYKDDNADEDV